MDLDQVLDSEGKSILTGVVRLKLFVERFAGELAGFAFVEYRKLRIEAKFVEMLAHELEAEAVQHADVHEVETRDLFRPEMFAWCRDDFFFQTFAETLAHFGGGGLGEGDNQQFVLRRALAFEAVKAAGDERPGLAGARAGHDKAIAARGNCLLLGRCEGAYFVCRFHSDL